MSVSSPDDQPHHRKKRVGKACDLCRIKKTKCDGRKPCTRCVADNQLCAFSEKKKPKEKAHPTGYIELLETRIDFLTRALLKVITMAEPHLPCLQDIMTQAKLEHSRLTLQDAEEALLPHPHIPINEVVRYLISEPSLLNKQDSRAVCTEATSNVSAQVAQDSPRPKTEPQNNFLESPALPLDLANRFSEQKQPTKLGPALGSSRPAAHVMRAARGPLGLDSRSLFHRRGSQPPSRSSSSHLLESSFNEPFSGISASNPDFSSARTYLPETGPANVSLGGSFRTEAPELKRASFESLEQFPQFPLLSSQHIHSSGGTVSTSPLSVLSLSTKFESQNFDDPARHIIRRLYSDRHQASASSAKRMASGHVHKPHSNTHSPLMYTANYLPGAGSQAAVAQTFPASACAYPNSVQREQSGTAYDFEHDLLFNEPPSKVFADGLPSFLEPDDLGMVNPFLSSFT